MSDTSKSYCTHLNGYSVVTFPKELCRASLEEIREAGEQVVSEIANQNAPQCLVDLTALDYMGSSMVASIVRLWKTIEAKHGRMVVAVSSIGVREVLRVTGLDRIWTLRNGYDAALHELGFSVEAKIVKRELRLLAFVGPATLVVGSIATALSRIPQLSELSKPPDWINYSLISFAVITSGISIFREQSWRRWLSVIVLFLAAPLLGWLFFTAEPTSPDSSSDENTNQVGSDDKKAGSDEKKAEGDKTNNASDNKSTSGPSTSDKSSESTSSVNSDTTPQFVGLKDE